MWVRGYRPTLSTASSSRRPSSSSTTWTVPSGTCTASSGPKVWPSSPCRASARSAGTTWTGGESTGASPPCPSPGCSKSASVRGRWRSARTATTTAQWPCWRGCPRKRSPSDTSTLRTPITRCSSPPGRARGCAMIAARKLIRRGIGALGAEAMVLAYHRVIDLPTDPQLLSVGPRLFDEQMGALSERVRGGPPGEAFRQSAQEREEQGSPDLRRWLLRQPGVR